MERLSQENLKPKCDDSLLSGVEWECGSQDGIPTVRTKRWAEIHNVFMHMRAANRMGAEAEGRDVSQVRCDTILCTFHKRMGE